MAYNLKKALLFFKLLHLKKIKCPNFSLDIRLLIYKTLVNFKYMSFCPLSNRQSENKKAPISVI